MSRLETLISAEQIQARIVELATEIRKDYGESEELLLVGVLKGSFHFLSDLTRQLGDNVRVDFLQTSSYGKGTVSSGIVQIRKDLDDSIEDKHVLLVEDIVDTGTTLKHLLDLLSTRQPKSLKIASLLSKPEAHKVEIDVSYLGFSIPKHFVVGYGLDHGERYRNLPYIATYHED